MALVVAAALTIHRVAVWSSSVEAAVQSDQAVSNKRLNALAVDLALVEAKLRAIDKRLEAVGVGMSVSSTVPLDVGSFCGRFASSSSAVGNPLKIDVMDNEDRARAEKAASDAIGSDADKNKLLARRKALTIEQATLWTRLAWEAVGSRGHILYP